MQEDQITFTTPGADTGTGDVSADLGTDIETGAETGGVALSARIFRRAAAPEEAELELGAPEDTAEPLGKAPLLVFLAGSDFTSGHSDPRQQIKIARRFTENGYDVALPTHRQGADAEDLHPKTRALLPELMADAAENTPEMPAKLVGAAALAATEDYAAFLRHMAQDHDHICLIGSGAGGVAALNLICLAEQLGLDLPPINSVTILSGGFAYPSFAPTGDGALTTPIMAQHGSHDTDIPVTTIRAFAKATGAQLIEDHDTPHGALPRGGEPLWMAVQRILAFDRREEAQLLPATPAKSDLRICVTASIQNQGPFLLEWVAHHRAIGVTDFVLFTHDCDDGTAALLDRMADQAMVYHIHSPAASIGTTDPRGLAAACAPFHPAYTQADYVVNLDVKDMLHVAVSGGTLSDLIAATGYADAIHLSERRFGFGGVKTYQNHLVTDQFTLAEPAGPACPTRILRRPDGPTTRRVDGAGAPLLSGAETPLKTRLGCVNHYALRSAESFLVELADAPKGRATEPVLSDYADHAPQIHRSRPALVAALKSILTDNAIAVRHADCVRRHRNRIATLKEAPETAALWAEIRAALNPVQSAVAAE